MFLIGVKDEYSIWVEKQQLITRSNSDISLPSLIADFTDEARENHIKTSSYVAMIGASNGNGKGKGKLTEGFPQNGVSRGNLRHCKFCENLQARHTTEKYFEDPRIRDAGVSWEKKIWMDSRKEIP